jgi:hypothetical protein
MRRILFLMFLTAVLGSSELCAAVAGGASTAAFPRPLDAYAGGDMASVLRILHHRIVVEPFNLVATIIFLLAIVRTLLSTKFMHLAHRWREEHAAKVRARRNTGESALLDGAKDPVSFKAEIMHFFGEVEAIFGPRGTKRVRVRRVLGKGVRCKARTPRPHMWL